MLPHDIVIAVTDKIIAMAQSILQSVGVFICQLLLLCGEI